MYQVLNHRQGYALTLQPYPIECGESIKLYRQYTAWNQSVATTYGMIVNDTLFRNGRRAKTMKWEKLVRSEGIANRVVKSQWYFWLTAWVDVINGGCGEISIDGSLSLTAVAKEIAAERATQAARETAMEAVTEATEAATEAAGS